MYKHLIALVLAAPALAGCSGRVGYIRPDGAPPLSNSAVVDMPREQLWTRLVPELGKRFFVINNLDKASGLINISYSGDPERYVDCGHITSHVKNLAGTRTYSFPGSRQAQIYEVLNKNVGLFSIDRRMALEGRMNLIVEDAGPGKSRLTANTRYVLRREQHVFAAHGPTRTFQDTVSFNTGETTSFSPSSNVAMLECRPTGRFEAEVISILK